MLRMAKTCADNTLEIECAHAVSAVQPLIARASSANVSHPCSTTSCLLR